ncbi:four helix bundle protein [Paracrocinitomix mangrovi]|uniref:four helix bundle protein n=1 Tax=Paracrocinitomix mangrovi TaxID=2862509 RepID=UPI001C8E3EF7|nr:four helix bundle protein [Paracrocinitomix mangrovi]UKN02988.1 four helix bundle protein [Paracrocinitomix mangrovi]
MHNYQELKVWQKAMTLVENTYKIYSELPKAEQFNFGSQITRCALSIPSNIAEGAGRKSSTEFKRFLDIATGSSYELETQLILIERIFKIDTKEMIDQVVEVQKMIYALNRSFEKSTLVS